MSKISYLSDRIRSRRTELDLTQQSLGDAVGVSHVTIFKWENGETEPKGKNLFSLGGVLRCSPTWLLYGDDAERPIPADELPRQLDERQAKLITLFNALPESEKVRHLSALEERVEHFSMLFEELKAVRKTKNNK
jgi:transcriptional regulator with XRE-family HTH domain